MTIKELQEKNKNLTILSINDNSPLFRKVECNFDDLIKLSSKLTALKSNSYIASDDEALCLKSVKKIEREIFAELPIQAGWCFGGNPYMNGMEWHKTSEVVVACSACVLLLGAYKDVIDDTYDSSKAIALYLNEGEAVELLPLTLHLAPLPIFETFKAAILLPKGTNLELKGGISGALRAVNKWLLVHKNNLKGIENGGKIGVVGENISLNIIV